MFGSSSRCADKQKYTKSINNKNKINWVRTSASWPQGHWVGQMKNTNKISIQPTRDSGDM